MRRPSFRPLLLCAGALAAAVAAAPGTPAARGACASTVSFTPSSAAQIPAIVAGCPGGTTFVFKAGTFRLTQPILPVTGDAFRGAGPGNSGTVLYGSKPITPWAYSATDELWEHSGDTVSGILGGGVCYSPDPNVVETACQYPDWLYRNGLELHRVLPPCTTANVVAGSFCIDYGLDRMYLGSDPSKSKIDYSYVPAGILDNVDTNQIRLRSMQFREFANGATRRAALNVGAGWVVKNVMVTHTHGCGVAMNGDSRATVENSTFSFNGEEGFCGTTVGARFLDNTVSSNNILAFDGTWAAGGGKFANSQNITVTGNKFIANDGTGLWFDVGDNGVTATGNTAQGNLGIYGGGDGIRFEVSCNGTIDSNKSLSNARAGIQVVNSNTVTVGAPKAGNTVSKNGTLGIKVIAMTRAGTNACGVEDSATAVHVGNNTITLSPGTTSGVVNQGGTVAGDSFTGNVYATSGACASPLWTWWDGAHNQHVGFTGWQALGQDATGACT
jgi:Right handed beta helix region